MIRILKCAKKVLQTACSVILILVLACNLYLIAAQQLVGQKNAVIFGCSTAVVVTGSMEPALSANDLILNLAQDSYTEGDIITFWDGSSLVTHRIIGSSDEGFLTKGDANNAVDPKPVAKENIVGRVVWKLPYIGVLAAYLKTPFGIISLILVGVLLCAFVMVCGKSRNKLEEAKCEHET